jgi:predicted nucleotidyltransferase
MATARTTELRAIAARLVEALPLEVVPEAVLTGSVSRGVADAVSDVEMLVVTHEQLDLETCFELARAAGLERLGTWGPQGTSSSRVSGYLEGAPFELIWWAREQAEASIDACFTAEGSSTADAIANGVALRTCGLLAAWQERLRHYPEELVSPRVEEAALTWGGFAAAGLLTIARPGERLALVERLVDDAQRILRMLYALNRMWLPTSKRLAPRAGALAVKPERLAERIEEALTEPEPLRALLVMTQLQADTVALAPSGPNVDRARRWLAEGLDILRAAKRET